MHVNMFGENYYFDEKAFAERMKQAESEHPWRIKEIVEIQRQVQTLNDLLTEHILGLAPEDPIDRLRKHLDVMIASGAGNKNEG